MNKKLEYIDTGISDVSMPLEEWLEMIQKLISLHGKDAILEVDSGYNNSNLIILKPVNK